MCAVANSIKKINDNCQNNKMGINALRSEKGGKFLLLRHYCACYGAYREYNIVQALPYTSKGDKEGGGVESRVKGKNMPPNPISYLSLPGTLPWWLLQLETY